MIPVKDVKSGDGMAALVASAASMLKGDLTELRHTIAVAQHNDATTGIESKGAVAQSVDPTQPISDSAESDERAINKALHTETSSKAESNKS